MSKVPKALAKLIELGQAQGHVTFTQLEAAMPPGATSSSAIEAWLDELMTRGIAVVDGDGDDEEDEGGEDEGEGEEDVDPRFLGTPFDLNARLATFADQSGIARSVLEGLLRPAWSFSEERGAVQTGDSHMYGSPHVPRTFVWPRDDKGRPLSFLAQLDCARYPLAGFPDRGSLVLFIDGQKHPERCSLHWFDASAKLEPMAPPPSKAKRKSPRARLLHGELVQSLPRVDDLVWQVEHVMPEAHAEAWRDLCSELDDSAVGALVYGGYPQPWQDDPRLSAAADPLRGEMERRIATLVKAGTPGFEAMERAATELGPALEAARPKRLEEARTWTVALQLASDESAWFVLVPTADLAARRFDRARLVVDFD